MAWTAEKIREWVRRENLSGLVAEHAEELAAAGGLEALTPEWLSQHGVRMLAPRQKIFAAVKCALVPGTKVCRFGEKLIKHYEAEEEVEEEAPAQRPQSDHKKEAAALVGRREEDDEDEDEAEDEDNDEEAPEAPQECESHLPEQPDLIQLAAFREPCGASSQNFTSSSRSLLDGSALRACTKQVDFQEIFAWKFMIKMFQCFTPELAVMHMP